MFSLSGFHVLPFQDNCKRFHMPHSIRNRSGQKPVSDVLQYPCSLWFTPVRVGREDVCLNSAPAMVLQQRRRTFVKTKVRTKLPHRMRGRPAGDQPARAGPRETLPQQTQRRPLTAPHSHLFQFWVMFVIKPESSRRHIELVWT
jgi:hypothetical protein